MNQKLLFKNSGGHCCSIFDGFRILAALSGHTLKFINHLMILIKHKIFLKNVYESEFPISSIKDKITFKNKIH